MRLKTRGVDSRERRAVRPCAMWAVLGLLLLDLAPSGTGGVPVGPPAVVVTILVDSEPAGSALDSTTHRADVTTYDSGSVSLIDTQHNTVVARIPLGVGATAVPLAPLSHRAYVTNQGGM